MPGPDELTVTEWDVTIERAQRAPHVEDKLALTAQRLAAASQRSRLRGDADHVRALTQRLSVVHELLDQF